MTKLNWINVNDRLPATCERVLTVEPHGYMSVCLFVPRLKLFYERNQERKVKFWAELPELPEQAEQGK